MITQSDPYKVLGISPQASALEIKSAWRKAAKQWHPDMGSRDAVSRVRFDEAVKAWELLKDPVKKEAYDGRFRQTFRSPVKPPSPPRPPSPAPRAPSPPMPPKARSHTVHFDQENVVFLYLKDLFSPLKISLRLRSPLVCSSCVGKGVVRSLVGCGACKGMGWMPGRRGLVPCLTCHRQGFLHSKAVCAPCQGTGYRQNECSLEAHLPQGLQDQTFLRVKVPQSTKDIFLRISLRKHRSFTPKEHDLWMERQLSSARLLKGSSFTLKLLTGEKIRIKVPAQSAAGDVLRIEKKGLPKTSGFGDLFIRLQRS